MIMPTCCYSLQKGTRVVAIIDIGFAVSGLILYFVLMVYPNLSSISIPPTPILDAQNPNPLDTFDIVAPQSGPQLPIQVEILYENVNTSWRDRSCHIKKIGFYTMDIVDISVLAIVVFVVDIWVATCLFTGSSKRSYRDCNIWHNIRLTSLVLMVILYIFYALQDRILPFQEIYLLALFVFRAYGIWIVNSYLNYIKEGHELRRFVDAEPVEMEEVKH